MGVIAEGLCEANMPFCVIDTEGEYSTLKNLFSVLVVGGDNADVEIDVDYSKLFAASIANDVPIVLDVSDVVDKKERVYGALRALYEIESKAKKPYLILMEEADKFAPQVVSKNINIVEEISIRGRKRGLGMLIATQRPANISKNVLAQCSYGFIGKLTIENDLYAVRVLFENRGRLTSVTRLGTGEFIPFGLGIDQKFQVKSRETIHRGRTPTVEIQKPSANRLTKIIRELKGRPADVKVSKKEPATFPIDVVRASFGIKDASKYAEKMTQRRFIMFGDATEKVDSVDLEYLPVGLCSLRLPTLRKNEYLEFHALINDRCELIKLDEGIKFLQLEGSEKSFEHKYIAYLRKDSIPLDKADAARKEVIASGISEKKARDCLSKFFPGSILMEFQTVHLPVYRITLRKENKVRVFMLDGIYGQKIEFNSESG